MNTYRLEQEQCILCACKHLATARSLLNEMGLGYPENYFFVMGEMSCAEAHLVRSYFELAKQIREQRKRLESNFGFQPDWKRLILLVAGAGDRKMQSFVSKMAKRYSGMSKRDLLSIWKDLQKNG
jgi:hypothetical protein